MGRFSGPGKHQPQPPKSSKDYDPQYPTDLSDRDWYKKLPKHTTFARISIPCINWFDNNPFDFLKPDPPKKPKKTHKVSVKKGKGPWESPWDKKSPFPYGDPNAPPWGTPDPYRERHPYKWPPKKDGGEYE